MTSFGPHVPASGPCPSSIMVIAEAPGETESERLQPLIGPSGQELRRMMATIGLNLHEVYKTNVFSQRPADNLLALYGLPDCSNDTLCRNLGPLTKDPKTFLNPLHLPHLHRLYAEIVDCNPNVIIALGNTACWALGLGQGINDLRGSVHRVDVPGLAREVKVVPTFHPAMVLRQWDQRVIAIADLEKAHAEAFTPEFTYDNTQLWLTPTLDDLEDFGQNHLGPSPQFATDVETKRGQITCVSFSPRVDISLAVPFWVEGDDPNYWRTPDDEALAWAWVRQWIECEGKSKVTQNGLYDLQYFIRHGMRPKGFDQDTMLAHHSLLSELRKGLGFLGSIYANVPSWKKMRTFKKEEILKKDD